MPVLNCIICHCGLDEENPFGALPCGHTAHYTCLQQELMYRPRCPMCMAPCRKQDATWPKRLFLLESSLSGSGEQDSASQAEPSKSADVVVVMDTDDDNDDMKRHVQAMTRRAENAAAAARTAQQELLLEKEARVQADRQREEMQQQVLQAQQLQRQTAAELDGLARDLEDARSKRQDAEAKCEQIAREKRKEMAAVLAKANEQERSVKAALVEHDRGAKSLRRALADALGRVSRLEAAGALASVSTAGDGAVLREVRKRCTGRTDDETIQTLCNTIAMLEQRIGEFQLVQRMDQTRTYAPRPVPAEHTPHAAPRQRVVSSDPKQPRQQQQRVLDRTRPRFSPHPGGTIAPGDGQNDRRGEVQQARDELDRLARKVMGEAIGPPIAGRKRTGSTFIRKAPKKTRLTDLASRPVVQKKQQQLRLTQLLSSN